MEVGQVFNLSGQDEIDEILSYDATLDAALVISG